MGLERKAGQGAPPRTDRNADSGGMAMESSSSTGASAYRKTNATSAPPLASVKIVDLPASTARATIAHNPAGDTDTADMPDP
jgi:hypothetical protein